MVVLDGNFAVVVELITPLYIYFNVYYNEPML